ncbi:MAG: hypothetical protein Q4B14_06670, partial [Clostridia bacterium]|nr:hypothetical protein [Clostridia bacterium]
MRDKREYQPDSYLLYENRFYQIRIRVELKEEIDSDILASAVNRAIKRYPYFSVKVKLENGEYILEKNERPVCVSKTTDGVPALGSDRVNNHLVSVDYLDRYIYFNMSHALAGACGINEWVKTNIYEYVSEKYNIFPDTTGIIMVGTPLTDGETAYPDYEKLPDLKPYGAYKKGSGYTPEDDYIEALRNGICDICYCIEIDQKDLMTYVKTKDATPAVILSVLMYKALTNVFPDKDEPIVCGIVQNMRDQLGCKNSYHDMTRIVNIRYTPNMADFPIDRLGTITRGMLMLQSQPENSIYDMRKLIEWHSEIDKQKTLRSKRILCAQNDKHTDYFLGDIDTDSNNAKVYIPYIKSIYPCAANDKHNNRVKAS